MAELEICLGGSYYKPSSYRYVCVYYKLYVIIQTLKSI